MLFSDPSGHAEACETGDLCRHGYQNESTGTGGGGCEHCGGNGDEDDERVDVKDPNIARQDRLFSFMFRGSGKDGAWTPLDWKYYYALRNELWKNPNLWLNPDVASGWDLFALHVERLGAHYSADQSEQFVRDFSLVFAGLSTTKPWYETAWGARDGNGEYDILYEGNEALNEIYLDDIHRDENTSHHYAGLFFLGYYGGAPGASIINLGRDADFWNGNDQFNPGDVALGQVAVMHGSYFRQNASLLSPADVAGWMRRLSP